ncbi:hypothetical protein LUW77_24995 [Streptomyces radiopugnans]|nr:hypothetical protein LUW77_24995 [Streptomyces radiopugnans]
MRHGGHGICEFHTHSRPPLIAESDCCGSPVDGLVEPPLLQIERGEQGAGQRVEGQQPSTVDGGAHLPYDTQRLLRHMKVDELLHEQQLGVELPHGSHTMGLLCRGLVQQEPFGEVSLVPLLVRSHTQEDHFQGVRPSAAAHHRNPFLGFFTDHASRESAEGNDVPMGRKFFVQLRESLVHGFQRPVYVTANKSDVSLVEFTY